jgi:3'(2'), 5'-bisphosphate nucleotidase
MKVSPLIAPIKVIARQAGAAIMDIYESGNNFQINHKPDDSPVTQADHAANRIICEGLENLSVKYPIISEENLEATFSERENYRHCWLVDPLDGTKEFIKHNGEFTVNIALLHDGEAILGVMYAPATGELHWAQRGVGAFAEKNGIQRRLRVSEFELADEALRIAVSSSHINQATLDFVARFDHPILVRRGSALKFMLLAAGEVEIYPRLGPTMEWDTAAPQIIIEEAGGQVLDANTLMPLMYNKPSLGNPPFLALGNTDLVAGRNLLQPTKTE